MTATERLARFVQELDPSAVPPEVREQTALCVLDALGIALAGMSEPSARAARAVARSAGGQPEARVVIHADRLPAPAVALVNGTAAFSHNFTDTTRSCVLPASRRRARRPRRGRGGGSERRRGAGRGAGLADACVDDIVARLIRSAAAPRRETP